MKKYLSLIAFAVMAVFSLAFVSCGDDDDDELNNGGNASKSEQFSFTINGKNYYYGRTYTWPGLDLKKSVTYCNFSPLGDYYGHSLFSLYLSAYDMPYKDVENPFGFHESNSGVDCHFTLIDFDPSTAKSGDTFGFKQVVKEVYNGVVYDIYNNIEYQEDAYSIEKSITFSWKDNNPKGQVKFVSYKKLEDGSYVLTLDFQNVTMDRITDNTPYSNKSDQLILNGRVVFADLDENPTGDIK